ncbi:Arylsulfatase I [Araneus ventricosus]|uniref:Arylsulfatase I n=1 Tax=Araneus ventricosus TaxID=182803 RepID=A0A4Y2F3V6_ARAVE|nr:Arylsulfatase I [Araneus ventricosus]
MNAVSITGSEELEVLSPSCIEIVQFLYADLPTKPWLNVTGLQHFAITAGERSGLPLSDVTLAQRLKQLGYATHMIGKWNLGYFKKEYTPTYRGFDTFLGYMNPFIGYYDHTHVDFTGLPKQPVFEGIDFYNGTSILKDRQGEYATHLFTETAENIIKNHNATQPLFLYLAHLAVHIGNFYKPLEAPAEVISKFKYIEDINRRIQAAMTSVLDDSVGAVFKALHAKNMLDNSIILFVSDNGGEVNPELRGHASNYPLRGKKQTFWEGGIHLPALIWSPLLNLDKPRISEQLMHVTDWLPTLYRAGGGDPADLGPMDGVDMWDALLGGSPSPRTEMLQNLDPIYGVSALRMGDMKLVNGSTGEGFDFWYGPSGLENFTEHTSYDWVFKDGSPVEDVLRENGMWIAQDPDEVYQRNRIKCKKPVPEEAYSSCKPTEKPCLFNITEDPCEYVNLADIYPDQRLGFLKHPSPSNSFHFIPDSVPAGFKLIPSPCIRPGPVPRVTAHSFIHASVADCDLVCLSFVFGPYGLSRLGSLVAVGVLTGILVAVD